MCNMPYAQLGPIKERINYSNSNSVRNFVMDVITNVTKYGNHYSGLSILIHAVIHASLPDAASYDKYM